MQNHGKCSFSPAISYAEDDYIKKYIEKMRTGGFNNLVGHSRSVNLLLKIYFTMLKMYVFFPSRTQLLPSIYSIPSSSNVLKFQVRMLVTSDNSSDKNLHSFALFTNSYLYYCLLTSLPTLPSLKSLPCFCSVDMNFKHVFKTLNCYLTV